MICAVSALAEPPARMVRQLSYRFKSGTAKVLLLRPPYLGVRSIAMSVSACVSVCPITITYIKDHTSKLHEIFSIRYCDLDSSFDDNAICYALTVFWMMSRLPVIGQANATPLGRILEVTNQGAASKAKCDVYDYTVYHTNWPTEQSLLNEKLCEQRCSL